MLVTASDFVGSLGLDMAQWQTSEQGERLGILQRCHRRAASVSSPARAGLWVSFVLTVLLAGCGVGSGGESRLKDGVLDLSDWDFARFGVVGLNGHWGFAWNELLSPSELQAVWPENFDTATVPDQWIGVAQSDDSFQLHGYATYFLRVLLPPNTPALSLKVRDVGTAYSVYVDGQLVHKAGRVGRDAESTEPGFRRRLVPLPAAQGEELRIVVHVANFHYRSGGIWEYLVLGASEDVRRHYELAVGLSIALASGIGAIGLYHLGLYSLRREDSSPLFFGLVCLIATVRLLSTDERFIADLFPAMTHDALFKLEYLSFLLAAPAFGAYFVRLMPGCCPPSIMRVVYTVGLLSAAGVAVSPLSVYSRWLPFFQLYLLFACAVGIYAMGRALRARLEEADIFMTGFAILISTVIADLLSSRDVVDTPRFLVGFGLFIFIVIQSYAMSRRSSQAFAAVEMLTSELEEYSATLEEKVKERTAELGAANTKLEQIVMIDGLTQINNRRHFDTALAREWPAHARRKATLSLLIMDIDHFKTFNDNYGHLKGDEALVAVAGAITNALSRPTDLAARYGGEEFVVLLPDTDAEGAWNVAERILAAVAVLKIPHQGSEIGRLSLSVGAATMVPEHAGDAATLLEEADQNLYAAKADGRNRVVAQRPVASPDH